MGSINHCLGKVDQHIVFVKVNVKGAQNDIRWVDVQGFYVYHVIWAS
jgi:carotenoid cleavage dioxygenase-like enzyme